MIVLRYPRVFHGAPKGWFDLCGWDTITITQNMVGTKIAVFVGEEIKAKGDRLRPLQKKLGELLQRMGGIWRVIRDQ